MEVKLVLEDGSVFEGESFGTEKSISGEVVFNTGMVGYNETLTDPSYSGQLLVLTYPLIGNYGVPDNEMDKFMLPKHFESEKMHLSALIVSENVSKYDHWNAKKSLSQWMEENNVTGIQKVDTRQLTKKLREKGVMLGKIVNANDSIEFKDPNSKNLVAEVSTKERKVYNKGGQKKVVVVDCGVKNNILRMLCQRGCEVIRVPWDHNIETEEFDGLLISNGPGDPKMIPATVDSVKKAMEIGKPTMGVCLGNQIMALASGGETYKLKYGHRGQNQPCITPSNGRCYITSQNHGFAVDSSSLNDDWTEWFVNANDGTNEGIIHKTKPFFGFQAHPEASPGPNDSEWIFDKFLREIK